MTIIAAQPGFTVLVEFSEKPWPVVAFDIEMRHEPRTHSVSFPVTTNDEINYLIRRDAEWVLGNPNGWWSFKDGEQVDTEAEARQRLQTWPTRQAEPRQPQAEAVDVGEPF